MKQTVTITGENMIVVANNASEASAAHTSKAEMRIAALKAKGIDTSCYFPLGSDSVVKIEDGVAVPVEMMDEVEKKMVEGGYINHYTLFRRWVMSQMFHMLRQQERSGDNFTRLIQDRGYEYSWRVVENELNAQMKMFKHGDTENYNARSRWFNKTNVVYMVSHYIAQLQSYVDSITFKTDKYGNRLYKHRCKGVPYVRLGGKNIFVSDLDKKLFVPLVRLRSKIKCSCDVIDLYNAVFEFNRLRKKLKWNTKLSDRFVDAYKGSGAYFTCKNLIMFHGALFRDNGEFMSKKRSLAYLEEKAVKYSSINEEWRMMGVLKQLISDSGISIQGKIDEWSK